MSTLSHLVPVLLRYHVLLKLYHWQTTSYARHKASDDLYDRFSEFIDHLVEYGSSKTTLSVEPQTIGIYNMTDDMADSFLDQLDELVSRINLNDEGIRARRDDFIGYIHQARYLFQLM